jgi:hypothetical protein
MGISHAGLPTDRRTVVPRLRGTYEKEEDARKEKSMNESSNQARVAEYIRTHPEETYAVISRKLGIGYSTVARIAALSGIRRPSGRRLVLDESLLGGGQEGKG